jgi:hypothetical protein
MSHQCQRCSYVVALQPGEKSPPWCPRCGGDLKVAAPELVGAAAAIPASSRSNAEETPALPIARRECRELEPLAPVAPADDEETAPAEPEEVFATKLIWQAIAWVCVLVCLGIVGVAASQAIKSPWGKSDQRVGIYGCMGLFGIGVVVSALVGVRFAGQKYEVFADRLVEWQFFRPTTYLWGQIREVYQAVHPTWTTYRVVTSQGTFTLHGELKNHKRLGELISQHVASLLLPAALRELEAGRDIRFGPLRVTAGGVIVNGELEPWHRIGVLSFGLNPNPIRGTSMVSKMVHLRLGSAWVELGEIPNYRLFELLARHLFPACVALPG